MPWRSMAIWVGGLVALGLLYGAWMQRTRRLLQQPQAPQPAVEIDEATIAYVDRAVGAKAKSPCQACNPEHDQMVFNTMQWVKQVMAQEKARRR